MHGDEAGPDETADQPAPVLTPADVLGRLRSLVVQIDPTGTVVAAHGALDGIAGYATSDLVGRSVFDLVAEEEHDLLTEIFLARAGELAVVDRPMPFPLVLVSADGERETIDALPNVIEDGERGGWIVQLTPQRLHSASVDLIDVVVNGGSLDTVADVVAGREQTGDHESDFLQTHVVMDVGLPTVRVVARSGDARLLEAVRVELSVPDHPFRFGYDDGRVHTVPLSELGDDCRAAAEAAGFEALHIGMAGDGGSVTWCVLWFVVDERVAAMQLNADLPRRAMLKIITYALERRRAEAMLRSAAETDPLTGVGNRALFDSALERVAGTMRVGVLYTDLDGFKSINDTYGHAVGDEVLMVVARRMAKVCRPVDVLARIGGDEFALLVPDAHPALLHEIAERLDTAIRQPMMVDGQIIEVGASTGVAMSSTVDSDPRELVRTADLSMLANKRSTRRLASGPSWWPSGLAGPADAID